MATDSVNSMHGEERGARLEKYLLMNEKEKDEEIQKAVVRLQTRIQKILYLLETDVPHTDGAEAEKK